MDFDYDYTKGRADVIENIQSSNENMAESFCGDGDQMNQLFKNLSTDENSNKSMSHAASNIEFSDDNDLQDAWGPSNYILHSLNPNDLSDNSVDNGHIQINAASHDTLAMVTNDENGSIGIDPNSYTRNKEDTSHVYSARSVLRDIRDSWSSNSYALKYLDDCKSTSDIGIVTNTTNVNKYKSDIYLNQEESSAASSSPTSENGSDKIGVHVHNVSDWSNKEEASSDEAAKILKLDKLLTKSKSTRTKHSDTNQASSKDLDDEFPPAGCVCLRTASKIRCNACGYTFIGRLYENCTVHDNMGVMLGASFCIKCVASSYWLEKIPCDDEDLYID